MKVKEESTRQWEEGRAGGGMMPRYHFADAADDCDGNGDDYADYAEVGRRRNDGEVSISFC